MEAKIMEIVSANPVTVFSKTDSPMCASMKQLFSELGVSDFKAVELDTESDGAQIEAALRAFSADITLPKVFVAGKFIGGTNEMMSMHLRGSLLPLLKSASECQPEEV